MDTALALLRWVGLIALAVPQLHAVVRGQPLRHSGADALVLTLLVVLPTLLREQWLWPLQLPQTSIWIRYRLSVMTQRRHHAAALLTLVLLLLPIFSLQQRIGYGALLGEWTQFGFLAWLRSLYQVALGLSVSAVLWWTLLLIPIHAVWLVLAARTPDLEILRRRISPLLWFARALWVLAPVALLVRSQS
ncbi:MAG: hypothetical protein ACT4TC_10570 [Myxococcaceae bacterium]